MIAVVQRVSRAEVRVDELDYRAAVGSGLCVLLGVEQGDEPEHAAWMAKKLTHLRIFRDDHDRMNRSVQDVAGEILLVSQFTLAGDCAKGHRPSFVGAAAPELGEKLYEEVARLIESEHDVAVHKGVFGAMMAVELVNDGPVTLIVKHPAKRS
jgi:D-tyrosyl-tRNA(Tyr) deacylase